MAQPSTVDLLTPFDPTGLTVITGAQLEQLVAGSSPYSDKGFVVVTTDVGGVSQAPNANVTLKWQTYLWLRISPQTTSFALYAWNPNQGNPDVTLLNWQSIASGSIPAGSIQGFQIAANTITKDKIVNIDLSQVNGSSALVQFSDTPAAGDITGTYTLGFTILNGAVVLAKLDTTGLNKQILANVGDHQPAWTTPPAIYTGTTNPNVSGADDGKLVAVNSGAAGTYKYISPAAAQHIQQIVIFNTVTTDSTGTTINTAHTIGGTLTFAEGKLFGTAGTNSGLIGSITPQNALSTLIVEVETVIDSSVDNVVALALFKDITGAKFSGYSGATPAINAVVSHNPVNLTQMRMTYSMVAGQVTAMDFAVRFGPSGSGTMYINRAQGGTLFGGTYVSTIKITEYAP